MRKRARTDLCGGRSAMVVPTATTVSQIRNGKSACGLRWGCLANTREPLLISAPLAEEIYLLGRARKISISDSVHSRVRANTSAFLLVALSKMSRSASGAHLDSACRDISDES